LGSIKGIIKYLLRRLVNANHSGYEDADITYSSQKIVKRTFKMAESTFISAVKGRCRKARWITYVSSIHQAPE
jgi:hypothetical protein